MKKSLLKSAFDYIIDVLVDAVIIILIVVVVRNFIISPFQVNWNSMNDTFFNNDYIFIEKLSYRFSKPSFLDVIVFEPPIPRIRKLSWFQCFVSHLNNLTLSSASCEAPDFFIKRVIWVPWDTISFKDWAVYRNWQILDESLYLNKVNNWNTEIPLFQNQSEFTVPENSVFVLWDNRTWSSDSRYWKETDWTNKSFVDYKHIEGKYLFRLFSPNKIFN